MNWRPQLQSSKWIWIAFGCCACLVLAAMLWLTRSVIKTEYERSNAEIRAELQERVRLSLWRMDSLGTSLLLEENLIPVELFLKDPESRLPVTARFETPDGAAIRGNGEPESLDFIGSVLPKLASAYVSAIIEKKAQDEILEINAEEESSPNLKVRGDSMTQETANLAEKRKRSERLDSAVAVQRKNYGAPAPIPPPVPAIQPQMEGAADAAPLPPIAQDNENPVGEFKAARFEDSLFLIRQGVSNRRFLQGSLVDEKAIIQRLLSEASPLLPDARLEAAPTSSGDSFVLASFPFKLLPGTLGITSASIPRTISVSLAVGWLAAIVALITAFFLISRIMELSERRASFVSAVTHELRTPLTTFRLYSDMLNEGAVKKEKMHTYLSVLSREADRLSHLVENVLSFSKMERGSARSNLAELDLNQLLESFRERFSTRLEAANLNLEYNLGTPVRLTLDSSALEHILFNLIDNAAKYAANSSPPAVSLTTEVSEKRVYIGVSDNGPGISKEECVRIFRPFHKSAKQAAETKPGVGLGLALSKRLAQSMHGKLSCGSRADGRDGAVFGLSLPRL
ncbi:sensor histidine kinase [Luteolibacter sp. AS25]|uniref:sensor histidine kinase n=1 Tax=Luteolibacter sp. AS25 TaxID=3135776 RepID=UPI00398B91AD